MELDLTCFHYSDIFLKEPEGGVHGGGVLGPQLIVSFVALLSSLALVKRTLTRGGWQEYFLCCKEERLLLQAGNLGSVYVFWLVSKKLRKLLGHPDQGMTTCHQI